MYYGICGSETLVTQFRDFCVATLGIRKNKVIFNKTNNIFYWSFSRKSDLMKFYEYIYDNSTIYLERKKLKFEDYYEKNKDKFTSYSIK